MILSLALLCGLIAQSPGQVMVEPIAFDVAAWKKLPRTEVKVKERDEDVTYSGVPLHHALKDVFKDQPEMKALRSLSDAVLIVGASDEYQVAVSAAAVGMDPKGERFLIAFERDGKPLGEGQGPAKLIVTGDPQHVRWIRMVSSVALVRLPKLPKAARP